MVEARKEIVTMYKKLTRGDERHKNVRVLIEGVLLISYDEGEEALDALEVSSLPILFASCCERFNGINLFFFSNSNSAIAFRICSLT